MNFILGLLGLGGTAIARSSNNRKNAPQIAEYKAFLAEQNRRYDELDKFKREHGLK